MMPQMGMGPGGPPQGGPPNPALMQMLMAMQAGGGAPGGPPGMPPPGMGAPPLPPNAMGPPGMGGPMGPPDMRPGMMDKVTEGLTIMKTIGEQVLRMMDPSDERADRLATCVQEISALVSQVNLGAPQGAGEPMGGMPPPPGNPQTAESEKMV